MRIILGIGLEICAFAVLLVSETLVLPLTFSLLIHLNAVYFFTRGFDRRLLQIHLRRELCFFFSFIFPLAGMVGILFYVLVLTKIGHRLVIPAAKNPIRLSHDDAHHDESEFLEEDSFYELSSAFIRKIPYSPRHRETPVSPGVQITNVHYREKEYMELETALALKIHSFRQEQNDETIGERKRLFAESLLDYVSFIHTDKSLREHYLGIAASLYNGGSDSPCPPEEYGEAMIEIAFQRGDFKRCLKLCETIRKSDPLNFHAVLRMGECCVRLKEFKKLSHLARDLVTASGIPEGLKEIASLWYRYG